MSKHGFARYANYFVDSNNNNNTNNNDSGVVNYNNIGVSSASGSFEESLYGSSTLENESFNLAASMALQSSFQCAPSTMCGPMEMNLHSTFDGIDNPSSINCNALSNDLETLYSTTKIPSNDPFDAFNIGGHGIRININNASPKEDKENQSNNPESECNMPNVFF